MPFRPFGGRSLGGRVNRPRQVGTPLATAASQAVRSQDPRAPSPAKPSQFLTSGKVINTESATLLSSAIQGQSWNLPTLGDIVGFQFNLQATSATGSASVSMDWANAIQKVVVRNRNGNAFDTIYFGNALNTGVTGNASVYDYDTVFLQPSPTSVRTNVTNSATALTGIVKNITLPGVRCSAIDGPWALEVWYNGLTPFGGTGVTAAVISNRIRVLYGNAGGYNTKWAFQTIPTTGTGDYHLETTGIIKNTLLNQVFLQQVSTLTNLDHIVINSHGMNIDTNLNEAEIVAGMTDYYYNAFNALTLLPTAAINSQFTIGDSDEFILNMTSSCSNIQVAYQYLLPAGDAY